MIPLITASLVAEVNTSEGWKDYYKRSQNAAQNLHDHLAREQAALENAPTVITSLKRSAFPTSPTPDWYTSKRVRRYAENLLSYQCPNGGWSKKVDLPHTPRPTGAPFGPEPRYTSTIDNRATTSQIYFLAEAYSHTHDNRYRESAEAGIRYLLNAQYPNGGWPQIYPLVGKYHDHATFNDQAIVNVLSLLAEAATPTPSFKWIKEKQSRQIRHAYERGIAFILNSQIQRNGRRLGWCQQHNPKTLAPVKGRAYEMVALSSAESAQILDLLLKHEPKSPQILASIAGVATWLESSRLSPRDPDGSWARFYEIESNRPLFGDRDGSIHYDIQKISKERRENYAWYTNKPQSSLNRFRKWKSKQKAINAPYPFIEYKNKNHKNGQSN